jgi:hypothetical protein
MSAADCNLTGLQWRALRDELLSEASGVPGGIFVHANGFIGGHSTRCDPWRVSTCSLPGRCAVHLSFICSAFACLKATAPWHVQLSACILRVLASGLRSFAGIREGALRMADLAAAM